MNLNKKVCLPLFSDLHFYSANKNTLLIKLAKYLSPLTLDLARLFQLLYLLIKSDKKVGVWCINYTLPLIKWMTWPTRDWVTFNLEDKSFINKDHIQSTVRVGSFLANLWSHMFYRQCFHNVNLVMYTSDIMLAFAAMMRILGSVTCVRQILIPKKTKSKWWYKSQDHQPLFVSKKGIQYIFFSLFLWLKCMPKKDN